MKKSTARELVNNLVMKSITTIDLIIPLTSSGVLSTDDAQAAIKQTFAFNRNYVALLNCIERKILDKKDAWVRETLLEWARADINGLTSIVNNEIFSPEEVKPLAYFHATSALLDAIKFDNLKTARHAIKHLRNNGCLTDKDIDVLCLSVHIFSGELMDEPTSV